MAGRIRLFRLLLMTTLVVAGGAGTAYAHQPYLVNDTGVTKVDKPEVSKAFYARLFGEPAVYEIDSPDSFELYVNILVPDEVGIPTDLSVTVTRGPETLAVLDGPAYKWTRFYEPFGGDSYLMGPEWKLRMGPGTCIATVTRPGNTGRYVLAVGEREQFSLKDVARLFSVMPRIKRDFFGKSSIRAFLDPFLPIFKRAD